MKTLVLAVGLLLSALVVPAPAQANPCHPDDVPCMVDCLVGFDACGIYQFEPYVAPCQAGETGAVVVTGSNSYDACLPSVSVSTCPERGVGVVVWIGGRPTDACLLA